VSFDGETLLGLLPAIHRIRDAELAASLSGLLTAAEAAELTALEELPNPTVPQQQRRNELREKAARGPLKALMLAFGDELAVVEENLAQLYDDLFIETCTDWAIPYIGDLIGYEPLHALGEARGLARAEVAHTIALRRRKGTAAVLEQLARDVTGWNARAVEYFQLLGWTQYMNHLRPRSTYAPDMRHWEPLARIGGAFESLAHTVEVRRIESRRGRFNIPNIGIFLWRVDAYRHRLSPAVRVDDRRYLVSPLGNPLPLYTNPVAEDEITHLADPINVPDPIGRRALDSHIALYYGTRQTAADPVDNADPSIVLYINGTEVPRSAVVACNLADMGAAWAHVPPDGRYAIDPVLGRVALAADLPVPRRIAVTYHYGFSAPMGGGEYSRVRRADAQGTRVLRVPDDRATIQGALTALAGSGVVQITDSGRYEETLSVHVIHDGQVILRAAEQCRPTLALGAELTVTGDAESGFALEGLLVAGNRLHIPNAAGNRLARLRIAHATLVPGLTLDGAGAPTSPGAPSVVVELSGVATELDHAITGPLRIAEGATLKAVDSIIDATAPTQIGYCAPDSASPGGELSLDACTVIGKITAAQIGLVSNSLILAEPAPVDTLPPVYTVRRQIGCVRFSFLPFDSLAPRRHRCQPESAEGESAVAPRFTSLRYGVPAYCQLAPSTPDEIRRGADDESEMGAFHALFPAQRETNLLVRLREFLRVGLSAGIFYAS
jgi:hypothetical protein